MKAPWPNHPPKDTTYQATQLWSTKTTWCQLHLAVPTVAPGSVDAWPASFCCNSFTSFASLGNTTFDRVNRRHLEFRQFGRKLWGAQVKTIQEQSHRTVQSHFSEDSPTAVTPPLGSNAFFRGQLLRYFLWTQEDQVVKCGRRVSSHLKVSNLQTLKWSISRDHIKEVASCSFKLSQINNDKYISNIQNHPAPLPRGL